MESKKWCIMFAISLLTVVGILVSINILIDPFGVFGDKIFNWYSYSFTNNPRVGKIAYLDKHFEEYDSYIIGCSSTSSFPTEDLNKYFNANFYNMIMYGADMLDVEETARYILNNYNPKNIVINVYLGNGLVYNEENDNITRNLHANVNGESKLNFYTRYMLLDPRYSLAKIQDATEDTYLTKPFDVFNIKTGAYDKKVRDVEPIGRLENYIENYPVFANYPHMDSVMTEIDSTVSSIRKIKEMCEEKNVNFVIVTAPLYYEYLEYFSKEDVSTFYKKIAEESPFWDFASSSISKDSRFFYDETHFRNAVGKMAIARMFNDKTVYYPEDFGVYVTNENVDKHLQNLWDVKDNSENYEKQIPILMYHHITEDANSSVTITTKLFREHMEAIKNAGYTTVFFEDLIDYVEKGKELPEKTLCITFDDGYYSNYEIAYPILKELDMKATIFVVGSTVGNKENYKETNFPITPHFNYEEAKEMEDSGVISIQSHTYDMHQWAPYESGDKIRETAVKLENESEEDFIKAMQMDFEKISSDIKKFLNKEISVVAYPHGKFDTLSNVVLNEMGVKVTLGTKEASNVVIKGLPQSLIGLNRFNICEEISVEMLYEYLK